VVTSRKATAEGTRLVARMGVGYKSIREEFTSQVDLDPAGPEILVQYLEGPFHHMENRWRFHPAPGGAEVDFFIDYEFRSRMLAVLMGSLFDSAFRRFSAAFEERARLLHGRPGPTGTSA
jgi:coenzyme Q-binding protein COQ10